MTDTTKKPAEKNETITAIVKPPDEKAPRPIITQSFTPELEAVAMTSFVFQGVAFDKDAPFRHHAMNVDKATLNGLWLSGLIRFVVGTDKSTVQAGEIEKLADDLRIAAGKSPVDAVALDTALERLVSIAKGNSREVAPPPIVYKEDPADEPDPAELQAMKDKVRATVPKPAAKKPAAPSTP